MKAFEEKAAAAMERYHVPGVALAVTDKDQVLYEYTAGVRDREKDLPVTPETRFVMASCTKSMTSALVGLLADRGVVDLDTPVRTYAKDFDMSDPAAREGITFRDILCHRSGLGGHDGMWPSGLDHREFLRRLGHLKPNLPFRYRPQYSNVMFTAAGYICEQAAGRPWKAMIEEEFFKPLGMAGAGLSAKAMGKMEDHAIGYEWRDGKLSPMPEWEMEGAEPAAGLCASLRDMEKWIRFQLADGVFEGRRIVSEKQMKQMHAPQMARAFAPWVFDELPDVGGYGLGWVVRTYRGQVMIYHHGEIEGYCSLQVLLPGLDRAVVMMANKHSSCHGFFYTLLFPLIDRMMGIEDAPSWDERIWRQAEKVAPVYVSHLEKAPKDRLDAPFEKAAFLGAYVDEAYGAVHVREDSRGLILDFHGQELPMEPLGGSLFKVEDLKEDTLFLTLPVWFEKGDREEPKLSILLEPLTDPVVFRKISGENG